MAKPLGAGTTLSRKLLPAIFPKVSRYAKKHCSEVWLVRRTNFWGDHFDQAQANKAPQMVKCYP